jgi:hypothetical protein
MADSECQALYAHAVGAGEIAVIRLSGPPFLFFYPRIGRTSIQSLPDTSNPPTLSIPRYLISASDADGARRGLLFRAVRLGRC